MLMFTFALDFDPICHQGNSGGVTDVAEDVAFRFFSVGFLSASLTLQLTYIRPMI